MKIQPACYSCILRQVIEASQKADLSQERQYEIMHKTMDHLLNVSRETSPPEVGQCIHRMVRNISGNPDPYHDNKVNHNQQLLGLLPSIKQEIARSEDPLRTAITYSIAGNVIDFGTSDGSFDIRHELDRALQNSFCIDHYEQFKIRLEQSKTVLILGDNAGEIVLDRVLVEIISGLYDTEITYVVRGNPVLNDVTTEDAAMVGMDRYAKILSNGSDAPATIFSQLTREVQTRLNTADIVIAKGQGNFESMSDLPQDIYFFFKVKCPVVADYINAEPDSYVLGYNDEMFNRSATNEYAAV